ncbi:UMP kinase, partial [Patescibacteria group bacterium]|nr:UMP kinase [Patescibacteria group bacterium]
MSNPNQAFVLSLGGSLVVPNGGIDTEFLSAFNAFIRHQISSKKRRFFIVVGGGTTAGKYIEAGKKTLGHDLTKEDQDWLGIHSTRLNAQLIRTIFRDIADHRVIKHYEIIFKTDKPVAIAAGWKPGWSTDYDAVVLCQDYNIGEVINLSNIDKIFTKDPRQFSDAKPIDSMSWKEYRKIAGDKWTPRMNVPFDPIAAKLADELGITVRFLNGKNL